MISFLRAIQVIVRPRLTNRKRPFPLITTVPCEVGFKGFNSHDMPLALFALRIDVGAWLIHFLDSLLRAPAADYINDEPEGLKMMGELREDFMEAIYQCIAIPSRHQLGRGFRYIQA
jgi:hypothetical protein